MDTPHKKKYFIIENQIFIDTMADKRLKNRPKIKSWTPNQTPQESETFPRHNDEKVYISMKLVE